MEQPFTASIRLALGLLAAVFALQVYRAAATPIGVTEAYLYDRFVRPTARQVLASQSTDRDVLYSVLEKRSVGLFHVSPFSVRLPSLLFCILYLVSIWQLAARMVKFQWQFWAAVAGAAAVPLWVDWFARAEGHGAALSLLACAALATAGRKLNLAGICIGLSIAAQTAFVVPAIAVALAPLALHRRVWEWIERVAIPATVVVTILLTLPLTHADTPAPVESEWSAAQAAHLQAALRALRASAGGEQVSIATVPAAQSIVNFYRAQHRANTWQRASPDDDSSRFDYYLLPATPAGPVEQRHLIVVYRDADFVLARRGDAPM
ncbi:MAG TPA: hypothetical protein VHW09_18150 [Bryobacteraceae bacterium]|jgi:4-amino-4-deoxy-L-arabinose transferase-like glycosyltransferase|nr:hypothetical protein [Bryobacteraceae bacterium]